MFKDEYNKHCQDIADELHDIAVGSKWKCNWCDCVHDTKEEAENCCENGCAEEYSMFDYIRNALDIRFMIDGRFEYLGASLLVGFGGPNIYVKTFPGQTGVFLYWGCSDGYADLSLEAISEIDEACEEYYNMR